MWRVYQGRGLVGLAVSSSTIGPEDPADLAAFVAGMGLTMTVLADWDADVYDDWRITVDESFAPYPREFVIDRDGRIAYTSATIDVDALSALLDDLL